MAEDKWIWWRDGVIYQIYPRSFSDSNGDGIGDINGIISKLDYLTELGIDAIWLSPIYPSPDVDFGYDVSNYLDINPRFGSLTDFDKLLYEAHNRNIKIILDLVLNHTSDQHPWFQSSRCSKNNPYSDWYLWRDPDYKGNVPNNWQSLFGGKGWKFEPMRQQYYYHMFFEKQPDLNWRNSDVKKAMLDVFRFWLNRGVDGFRLDVFNMYFKNAKLLNNPTKIGVRKFDRQIHLYDVNQPEMFPLLVEIRQLLDTYDERYVVGEPFLTTTEEAASYCGSDALHGVFNFNFLKNQWNPRQFQRSIIRWEQALSQEVFPTYVLNNHDKPRTASRFGQGENDERLKVAATLLLTQRGTPFIYYGEEIGMRDIKMRRQEIQDPVGKFFYPFYKGRDGCRSPMQWSNKPYAGFSTEKPWLKIHPNYHERNVEAQRHDPDSLYQFYRRLLLLRKQFPAIQNGTYFPLIGNSHTSLSYLRKNEQQTILVALNFSNHNNNIILDNDLSGASWDLLLSNCRNKSPLVMNNIIQLDPNEACIMIKR